MRDEEEDTRVYKVVVNHEEQYSIWLAHKDIPSGWREAGKSGSKDECLAHIKEVWTDMRPLSLRNAMEEMARNPPPPIASAPSQPRDPLGKDSLVARLEELQPVEAELRPVRTIQVLREGIERGYVFMKFERTGTGLGVRLDRPACDFAAADLEAGKGVVKLVGDLVLNYNKVRYSGDLDLETLRGSGRLEFVTATQSGSS